MIYLLEAVYSNASNYTDEISAEEAESGQSYMAAFVKQSLLVTASIKLLHSTCMLQDSDTTARGEKDSKKVNEAAYTN